MKNTISTTEREKLLTTLKTRFLENMHRHNGIDWKLIQEKLLSDQVKLWSLQAMEETGGEPDVVIFRQLNEELFFVDCSDESPKGRRSLCYDPEALESRKENKPKNSALRMAASMGIEILDETNYRELQKLGEFDTKTSSWIKTPEEIRERGGAVFCDRRYNTVFYYHNGAESYYAARGFRGLLKI